MEILRIKDMDKTVSKSGIPGYGSVNVASKLLVDYIGKEVNIDITIREVSEK